MNDPVGTTPVLYFKIFTERATACHPNKEHQNSSAEVHCSQSMVNVTKPLSSFMTRLGVILF